MAFNNVPANGWPQIKELEKLEALAKQIEDMPTFSSSDRAWLDEWEAKLPELPEDPETDGVKVLKATTESGETVKSWGEPEIPIASASTLGGVKVGSGLSINAETGVLSASGTANVINYEGDGNVSKSVQFSEKPTYILGVYNKDHPVEFMGFGPDQLGTLVVWEYPVNGMGHITITYDDTTDTLTWTGADAGQALNTSGEHYSIVYI